MSARALLLRLDAVRPSGPGRWTARCPAHDDRNPSLAIRECDDGRTLLKCFAGCGADEIVTAVGLTLADLMPPRAIGDHVPRERKLFNPSDILECVAHEALIVALAASDIVNGKPVSDADKDRIMLASSRLGAAAEIGGAA